MLRKLNPLKTIRFIGFNLLVAFIILVISIIPYFQQVNLSFVDQLHGRLPARKEIVVVAIDDKSLQAIGAWPWERSVFAQLIDKINEGQPKVIGVDVLFAEKRQGDEEFNTAMQKSSAPVVLASKLLLKERQHIFPIFVGNQISAGFINFNTDSDSKVRRTYLPPGQEDLMYTKNSFSFQILEKYFGSDEMIKNKTKNVGFGFLTNTKEAYFNYTSDPFTQVSVTDVINNQVQSNLFKDKIVLIGTTAIDIKSNLSDNLTDVFGNSTPGIVIHGNVINSFLENRFQHPFPFLYTLVGTLFICVTLSIIFRKIRSNVLDVVVCLGTFIIVNLIGIIAFDLGINWPFFTFSLVIIFTYVSSLAQNFILENKRRRFIQMAFAQYMNPALVKKLVDDPSHLKLGGEKREITVMFSDVRGFTSLSEKVEAEELVHLLNNYMDTMCEIVLNNTGTIDKFIGDAIMAFWNAPLDDNNHQANAIKTGLEMVEALDKFNEGHSYDPLKIGIGINTGEMVVGNIGSKRRFDYTVLGDNVNLGSRIEGLTKKYGLTFLVTESVIQNIKVDGIIFRQIDTVTVKGKSKPVKLFQPLYDTPENQNIKEMYELAFKEYEKGNFADAKRHWSALPTDAPSEMMLKRLSEVKDVKGWKGVWEWKEK